VVSSSAVSADPTADGTTERPRLAGELLVVAILVLAYDRIRDLARARPTLAINDAWQLLHFERSLNIAVELATNQWLAAHRLLAYVGSWYYQVAHLGITLSLLFYCYLRHPSVYRPARRALVGINALALVVFWCYPVAPPRLLPSGEFVDIAVRTGVAHATSTSAPNPYAAMPSLHTGWAMWVFIVGFSVARALWARLLFVLHGLLTVVVIVATGNHYLLDVVGGIAVALVALCSTGLLRPEVTARVGLEVP
jgi:hypothetical protein